VGDGVTRFKVGDHVTGMAMTPTYAEYCLMNEDYTVLVPEALADEDAVAEPLGCLVSVASKMRLRKAGDTVVVVGTGYMGLGMVTLFKLQGAGKIIAIDPREEARENALQLGATIAYHPDELPKDYRFTEFVVGDKAKISGFPLVQEFSGFESGLRLAGDLTAINGTLGIGGWHQGGDRTLDIRQWGWKGLTAINTHERDSAFQTACCQNALDMLVAGQWNFKGMVRHIYGLDEFDKANTDMEQKPKGFIKALIRCTDW
jgi:threonine dehydrogenase-like Zn-dependent dehydrogenase